MTVSVKKSVLVTCLSVLFYVLLFDVALNVALNLYQAATAAPKYDITSNVIFINLSNYLVFAASVYLVLDKNKKAVFLFTAVSWSLYQFIYFALNNFIYLFSRQNRWLFLLLSVPVLFLTWLLMAWFLKEAEFSSLLLLLEEKHFTLFQVILLSIGIDLAYAAVQLIIPRDGAGFMGVELLILMLCIAAVYFFLKNYGQLIKEREEKKYSEMMLCQQTLYVESLEEMQHRMRAFKHDFKNMMASLYLQSAQGDTQALERSLHQLIDDFDENIGHKMNLTNQLANIRNNELKSLLFQKMTLIDREKIPFHLEILYPVRDTAVRTMDLCRMLGILLDNAIEAAKDSGEITLILSSQQDGLHIIVENTADREIDLMQIYQEGFSTKGNGRGYGLASLNAIIGSYRSVSHRTEYRNGTFIQDIFIGKDGSND